MVNQNLARFNVIFRPTPIFSWTPDFLAMYARYATAIRQPIRLVRKSSRHRCAKTSCPGKEKMEKPGVRKPACGAGTGCGLQLIVPPQLTTDNGQQLTQTTVKL